MLFYELTIQNAVTECSWSSFLNFLMQIENNWFNFKILMQSV